MLKINEIYLGDCLEVMKQIDDKSIDMILCDLPYGTTHNKWDSIISLPLLWKQYLRIIKEHAAIILFGQDKFTARVMLSCEKYHRYNLIWKKGNRVSGFLNASRMPLRNHEDIMLFYKHLPTYNILYTDGIPLHSMGKRYLDPTTQKNNNYGHFIRGQEQDKRAGSTKKYPKSVLEFERPHPPIHPTQKPVELFEWLIKTYTNEGDLVLDNAAGSGTTGIACINTNRKYILIEKDPEYYNISRKRINGHIE